jgi:nicotinate-nucleotide adenylyltransferase
MSKTQRIGIYAGTFDPIHNGHLEFAQAAIRWAELDHVALLPERKPRHKHGLTSYKHRVAMVAAAVKSLPAISVLELPDDNFTVTTTLLELRDTYPEATLIFLIGSDVASTMPSWENLKQLVQECELIIGERHHDSAQEPIAQQIESWHIQPRVFRVVSGMNNQAVSSGLIRQALRSKERSDELSGEISDAIPIAALQYLQKHELYK